MSVNKVFLMGNIGKEPEAVPYNNGTDQLVKFSLATSEGKDKTPLWHNIKAFGKTGEYAKTYLTKGSKVFIEGRILYNTYQNKEGKNVTTTDIIAERIENLSPRAEATVPQPNAPVSIPTPTAAPAYQAPQPQPQPAYPPQPTLFPQQTAYPQAPQQAYQQHPAPAPTQWPQQYAPNTDPHDDLPF